MSALRIGIDLGGTKIEIAVLDEAGALVHRARAPTPAGDYEATIATVAILVEAAERQYGRAHGIGVGTPGSLSCATGCIKNANSTCLNGRNLHADLRAVLAREVRIANDANCFALAEARAGAGRGAGVVFGVILGTGVGGGVVVDGRLVDGPNGITGEWGHNRLVPVAGPGTVAGSSSPPRRCYCGREDCVETFLSGPALEAEHASVTGLGLGAQEIARRARAGDSACGSTIERYASRLAQALAVVVNILDPDVVVLGGGVSNIEALYELVPRRWGRWIFSDDVRTRLAHNANGDSAGVLGAAWLTAPD